MIQASGHWQPQLNQVLCSGCGYCIDLCPTDAITRQSGKAQLTRPDQCIYCFACEDVCPEAAIDLPVLILKQMHHPASQTGWQMIEMRTEQ